MTISNPKTSMAAITKICGELPDWKISAIEKSGASLNDLQVALVWAAGEDDVMAESGHKLEGAALTVYEILMADEDDTD